MNERYVEDATEKGPNYEQKKWEEEHMHAAIMKFGARDAKQKRKVLCGELICLIICAYSYVFVSWNFCQYLNELYLHIFFIFTGKRKGV